MPHETQSVNEHEPSDNDNVHVDAQPSNNNDVEIKPAVDLDNPQSKTHIIEDAPSKTHDM